MRIATSALACDLPRRHFLLACSAPLSIHRVCETPSRLTATRTVAAIAAFLTRASRQQRVVGAPLAYTLISVCGQSPTVCQRVRYESADEATVRPPSGQVKARQKVYELRSVAETPKSFSLRATWPSLPACVRRCGAVRCGTARRRASRRFGIWSWLRWSSSLRHRPRRRRRCRRPAGATIL